jgi:hypothetical protein
MHTSFSLSQITDSRRNETSNQILLWHILAEVIWKSGTVRARFFQSATRGILPGNSPMTARLIIALFFLTASLGFADTDAELSKKILGAWSERNHDVTFLPHGKWRLAKNGDVSPGVFRWHIKHGYLIELRDGVTFPPQKIVWVTPNEFFLEDDHGSQSAPYERHMGK